MGSNPTVTAHAILHFMYFEIVDKDSSEYGAIYEQSKEWTYYKEDRLWRGIYHGLKHATSLGYRTFSRSQVRAIDEPGVRYKKH